MTKADQFTQESTTSDLFCSAYLVRLSSLLIKKADALLGKRCDVTFAQFQVLLLLYIKKHVTQHVMAEMLHSTPPAISRLTETLAIKHYISRQENPHNRRENQLVLTDTGKAHLGKAASQLANLEQQFYAILTTAERQTFNQTLQKLHSHFLTMETPETKDREPSIEQLLGGKKPSSFIDQLVQVTKSIKTVKPPAEAI